MKYILVDTNTNEVILITEKYTIIDYLLDGGSVIINKKYYESFNYVFETKPNEKKEKDAEMFDNILTQLIRNDKLEDLLDEDS